MIQTVVKRDGRIVGFNREKIAAAIRKAMLTTERGEDEALVSKIVDRIEFRGNEHVAKAENGDFRAFSFRITAEDKVVVYSGDVRSPDEFADWSSKCDAVLMESGHHHPWEVCAKWKENGCEINKVIFMHHGRDYVNQPTQTAVAARRVWGKDVIFAEDDMIIEL